MAKNLYLEAFSFGERRLKPLSLIAILCALMLLNACGSEKTSRIPFFDDEKIADNSMRDSKSHMKDGYIDSTNGGKNLFGKNLRGDTERIERLERAVQDMRNEFNLMQPSIRRLMAIEGDIQSLIVELQKLSDNPSLADTMPQKYRQQAPTQQPRNQPTPQQQAPIIQQPAPAPQKAVAATMQKKSAPPVQNGKATVFDLRVGEHPGKTRIVFDVNTKTGFTADIDNGEKILVVEFPNADWSTSTAQNFGKSPYISSYKVESSGNGQLVIFQLKRNATISYKTDIGGTGSSRRIVIDLS